MLAGKLGADGVEFRADARSLPLLSGAKAVPARPGDFGQEFHDLILAVRVVDSLEAAGCEVFICAAGMAAHLAGAVAARTMKPVIGIPVAASPLGGMDALLATVQMPPGFPVATVALDKAGARNAAWLAAQILALHDPELAHKIRISRERFSPTSPSPGLRSKPSTVKFRKKSYGEGGSL